MVRTPAALGEYPPAAPTELPSPCTVKKIMRGCGNWNPTDALGQQRRRSFGRGNFCRSPWKPDSSCRLLLRVARGEKATGPERAAEKDQHRAPAERIDCSGDDCEQDHDKINGVRCDARHKHRAH